MRRNLFSMLTLMTVLNGSCRNRPDSTLDALPLDAVIVNDAFVRYVSVKDGDFCRNKPANQCFTLILQIPAPQLEKNFSLNTLALATATEKFRFPMLRACQKGISTYAEGHQGLTFTIRNKLFSRIKETRCVIDYVIKESYELPELAQGQFGMATRLSDWNLKGSTSELGVSPLTFEVRSANVDVAYRNAMIYSQPKGEEQSRWSPFVSKEFRPLGGFTPMGTRNFSLSFNGSMKAKFSTMETAESLAVVLEHIRSSDMTTTAIQQFISGAATTARAFMDRKVSEGSLTLVGIGLDALRVMKKSEATRVKLTPIDIPTNIKESFGQDQVIDSASNAIFTDSQQLLPAKLIDDAFWNSHGEQLTKALNLEGAP